MRGRVSNGYLTNGASLFSLPWYPINNTGNFSDFGVLTMIDQTTGSSRLAMNNYNAQYNLISFGHLTNIDSTQTFFIFHATYISKA